MRTLRFGSSTRGDNFTSRVAEKTHIRAKFAVGMLFHWPHLISDSVCAPLIRLGAIRLAPQVRVPGHFLIQLLAIEDKRFLLHPGVDPLAIGRAILAAVRGVGVLQGASTISQQVYSSRERAAGRRPARTLSWKIHQAAGAILVESRMRKAEILSEYLESAYWGLSYYGLDAAAAGYFGSTRERLTVGQGFFLAERLARPNSICLQRIVLLLDRPIISNLFARNEEACNELVLLYDNRFQCGADIWRLLEKFTKPLAVPMRGSCAGVSN